MTAVITIVVLAGLALAAYLVIRTVQRDRAAYSAPPRPDVECPHCHHVGTVRVIENFRNSGNGTITASRVTRMHCLNPACDMTWHVG